MFDSLLGSVIMHFYLCNSTYPDKERLEIYRSMKWDVGYILLEDMGVWDRAQGLPHDWCIGNVLETARHSLKAGKSCQKIQMLAKLIPDLVLDTIIVVEGKTERGRENCEKTRWNIDDGCMRAIAKAMKGYEVIRAYKGTLRPLCK